MNSLRLPKQLLIDPLDLDILPAFPFPLLLLHGALHRLALPHGTPPFLVMVFDIEIHLCLGVVRALDGFGLYGGLFRLSGHRSFVHCVDIEVLVENVAQLGCGAGFFLGGGLMVLSRSVLG